MPDPPQLAPTTAALAATEPLARGSLRIDVARVFAGIAPDDENLIALGIDVHAGRVPSKSPAVHAVSGRPHTGYATHWIGAHRRVRTYGEHPVLLWSTEMRAFAATRRSFAGAEGTAPARNMARGSGQGTANRLERSAFAVIAITYG